MEPEMHVYNKDSLLVTENEVYTIEPYNEFATEFFKGVAYLNGEYFYVYRGLLSTPLTNHIEPGIYIDPDTKKPILVEPTLDEEKEYYTYQDKISSYDPSKLINAINNKEQIIIPVSESSKMFLPEVNRDDDILKRLIKMAIIDKNIDLDSYKHRFLDRNALFNFKQCLKNDNSKLSILLFDRGIEAMNLKYTIILEEKDPDIVVGDKLKKSITVSSEDTYDF